MILRRSTRLALGAGALLLGSVVVTAVLRGVAPEEAARPPSPSAAASSAASGARDLRVVPQPTVPVRSWKPGSRWAYTYKSIRTFGVKPRDRGQGTRFELRLDGTLALTVVGAEADVVHLHAELRDARLSSVGAAPPPGVDDGKLRRPFFVTVERDGRVRSFMFEKSIEGETRNQLKSVIASMQFAAPERPEAQEWLATEQDTSGEYVARYSCAGTLPTVQKSKQRYTRVQSAGGLVATAEIGTYEIASRGAVVLESDGWPRTVDDDESVAVSLPGQNDDYTMAAKLSATLVGLDEAPSLVGAFEREAPNLDESAFDLRDQIAAANRQMDVDRVAGASFRRMLAELESLSPDSREDQRKGHVMVSRLGSLFRVDPKAAAEARDALVKRPPGMTSRVLVGGLSAAGTPEAQDALASVTRANEAPPETRVGAAVGLGLSERPTPAAMKATEEAMQSSDSDQHSSGALALGNQIRQAGASDPAATTALDTLIARLAGATNESEIVLYLDALGNTGDLRALPSIRRYLAHGDSGIRGTAYRALRFMDAPEVDPLLEMGLRIDPEPNVRIAALTAISFRNLERFAEAIVTALRSDVSAAVRSQIVALLIRHAEMPGAAEAVAWARDNDPDPGVRAAAQRGTADVPN